MSSHIMNNIYRLIKNTYYLRNFIYLKAKMLEHKNGLDCIAYRTSLPFEIRNSIWLKFFKHEIKTWCYSSHPCYCCKPFIHHLGFT